MSVVADMARPQNRPDSTWEQWCVLSDRPYVKFEPQREGPPVRSVCLLNEENCRQILANFKVSKDDLPATQRHDKGEALAFHNAMALVVGGRVVAFVGHDPSLAPPAIHQLPGSDRGDGPEDGIYVHRAELTHLGLDRVGITLKKISPEFHSGAVNSFGDSIGYAAMGSTYTNYPFLEGNEAQFTEAHRGLWHLERHMEPQQTEASPEEMAQLMQEAGIAPGDDQQTVIQKMCRLQKMQKAGTETPAAAPGQPAAKAPGAPPVQMEEPTVPAASGATPPGQAAAAPSGGGGAPTVEPGGKKPEGEQVVMERLGRLERLTAQQGTELQGYRNREAQRMASEKRSEAQAFAFERGAMGCIEVRRNETEDQAITRIANLYATSGKGAAEAALSDEGAHRAIGHGPMLHEYTLAGRPHGWQEPSKVLKAGERPDQALVRLAKEEQVKNKTVGQAFAFEKALTTVQERHPELVRDYQDPVRCGLYPQGFQA